ncbi:hypothetical protein FIV00_10835 [Labrenzia sp. THAF82]|uniref:hypothetical protein n=1 Tax=Labrenzia sp. THAF82 TaxID=2587861 RepID=UPI001268FC80|nr:hypothetical protein [Labrenzia sp. THAF82]QFT30973.1 hypothetical protein FIV00_10835 [Labrenzia sp. THAF82]
MLAKRMLFLIANLSWPFFANVVFFNRCRLWFAVSTFVLLLMLFGANDVFFAAYYIQEYSITLALIALALACYSSVLAWKQVEEARLSRPTVYAAFAVIILFGASSFWLFDYPDSDRIHFTGLMPVMAPGDVAITGRPEDIHSGQFVRFTGRDDRNKLGFVVAKNVTVFGVADNLPSFCDDTGCFRLNSICPLEKARIDESAIARFNTGRGVFAVSSFELDALDEESGLEVFRHFFAEDAVTGVVTGVAKAAGFITRITPINELIDSYCETGA